MDKKYIITILLGLFLIVSCAQYEKVKDDLSFLMPERFQCTVLKVYSGDSFLCQLPGLDDEKIKLIGVNIPQDKQEAAKKYTESVLKRGTLIKIETEAEAGYINGGITAYVFIQGNRMLNLILAEKGLADLNIEQVVKYKSQYIKLQEEVEVKEIEIIEEKEN